MKRIKPPDASDRPVKRARIDLDWAGLTLEQLLQQFSDEQHADYRDAEESGRNVNRSNEDGRTTDSSLLLEPRRQRAGKRIDKSVLGDSDSARSDSVHSDSDEYEPAEQSSAKGSSDGGLQSDEVDIDEDLLAWAASMAQHQHDDEANEYEEMLMQQSPPALKKQPRGVSPLDKRDASEQESTVDPLKPSTAAVHRLFDNVQIPITPFNLKDEHELGHFDSNGHFIFKTAEQRDPFLHHDTWLDGIGTVQMLKARVAQERAATEQAEKERMQRAKEDAELGAGGPKEWKRKLADMLEPNETVLEAVRQLGRSAHGRTMPDSAISDPITIPAAPKGAVARRRNIKSAVRQPSHASVKHGRSGSKPSLIHETLRRRKSSLPIQPVVHHSSPNETLERLTRDERHRQLDQMIALAHNLLSSGMLNIYDCTRRQLMMDDAFDAYTAPFSPTAATFMSRRSTPSRTASMPLEPHCWEYKWSGADNEPVYGPFTSAEMTAWLNQGFFGQPGSRQVVVRCCGEKGDSVENFAPIDASRLVAA